MMALAAHTKYNFHTNDHTPQNPNNMERTTPDVKYLALKSSTYKPSSTYRRVPSTSWPTCMANMKRSDMC